MNLEKYCEMFYSAHHLPITYFKKNLPVYSCGIPENSMDFPILYPLLQKTSEFPYVASTETGFYGILRQNSETEEYLLIGPVFATAITKDIVRKYMKEHIIANDHREEIFQYLSVIPHYSYYQFINLILFLEFTLNGRTIQIEDYFHISECEQKEAIAAQHIKSSYDTRETDKIHGSYSFEQQIFHHIQNGNSDALVQLLYSFSKSKNINEGVVGNSPVRQAKNVLIANAAIIGKMVAIPGGMDIEQAYQLIDIYSQECEQLQTIDAVANLQFHMILDFTNRIAQAKLPKGISSEIHSCIQYINHHINRPVSIQDVADHIKRSRAYTMEHLKKLLASVLASILTMPKSRKPKAYSVIPIRRWQKSAITSAFAASRIFKMYLNELSDVPLYSIEIENNILHILQGFLNLSHESFFSFHAFLWTKPHSVSSRTVRWLRQTCAKPLLLLHLNR